MQRYDIPKLALLAASTRSMNEFLDALEVPRTDRIRRNMWQRLRTHAIDTTHWERSSSIKYTAEMLAEAVAGSVSYAQTLRTLGVPVTGGQHAHLARRIRDAGIDTSHFLGQAHFRNQRLPGRDAASIFTVWPPGSGRPGTRMLRKALLEAGVAHMCAVCGCGPEWWGQHLVLTIDHMNGDWLDNRAENLRFLCPNCHAQTATWCRRNDRAVVARPA